MNQKVSTVNDPELQAKVKKSKHKASFPSVGHSSSAIISLTAQFCSTATEKISENMHIIANEPSLAFYRIQEHVRKVIPLIVERRAEVVQLQQDLQGKCYDMEYAIG